MNCAVILQIFLLSFWCWKYAHSKTAESKYSPEAQETEYKASYDAYEHHPPHPFHFGYDIVDEHGNKQQRQEHGDQHGTVKGSYGYTDAHGVYRQVEYVADHSGFRAVVLSNEPGMADDDPADVKLTVKPPPPHVYEIGYSAEPKAYAKSSSQKPLYKESFLAYR